MPVEVPQRVQPRQPLWPRRHRSAVHGERTDLPHRRRPVVSRRNRELLGELPDAHRERAVAGVPQPQPEAGAAAAVRVNAAVRPEARGRKELLRWCQHGGAPGQRRQVRGGDSSEARLQCCDSQHLWPPLCRRQVQQIAQPLNTHPHRSPTACSAASPEPPSQSCRDATRMHMALRDRGGTIT